MAQEDPEKYATSIPVLQLRDALFHSSHCRRDDGKRTMMAAEKNNSEDLGNSIENVSQMSEKDKKWIWKIVMARLQRNSNIRESMMTWKGDTHIVWEWIGPAVLSPKKK